MNYMFSFDEKELDALLGSVMVKYRDYLRSIDADKMRTCLVMLLNYLNMDASFNSNILICSDEIEVSNHYALMLAEAVESWFPDACVRANDTNLYEWKTLPELYRDKILVIQDFKSVDCDRLFNALVDIENNQWKPVVILCSTNEVVSELRAFGKQDNRLFKYLCGYKLILPEIDEMGICEMACGRMEDSGYICSDSFRTRLKKYIDAVYPEAVFSKNEFLEDLIYRITQTHYRKIVTDMELDESDVPYSAKAEIVLNQVETVLAEPEKTVETNIDVKGDVTEETISELRSTSSDRERTDEVNSKVLNVLITNVSKLNNPNKINIYEDEAGNKYTGIMTNEAPIKSIAQRLADDGLYLDSIIFIESNKTRDKINGMEVTHVDFLKNSVKDFLAENKKYTHFHDVPIADEPTANDVSQAVFKIYGWLKDWANENTSVNIFIESNGGVRYVLTMLLSLTKTLENYYENVHISEITSMVYGDSGMPIKIVNTKNVFDTAQITGIADEFMNYGRTNALIRYVEENSRELSDEQNADVNSILDLLNQLADNIQLCRTKMLLEDFYGENNIKAKIEAFISRYKSQSEIPATLSIVVHILELIMTEFNATIYKDVIQLGTSGSIVYLPKLIEWCLDKSFIQQALTLSCERMGEYLFKTNKIQLKTYFQEKLDNTNTKSYEKNYYFIAHITEFLVDVYNASIGDVLTKLRTGGMLSMLNSTTWDNILRPYSSYPNIGSGVSNDDLDKIKRLFSSYHSSALQDDATLTGIFSNCGFDTALLDKIVRISNNNTAEMRFVLRGERLDENNNIINATNIANIENRIAKVLPVIVKSVLDDERASTYERRRKMFDDIISDSLSGEIVNVLCTAYSESLSEKYWICDALDNNYLDSNMSSRDLQNLMYLYSICKEQRNMANHAHVSEDNKNIALNPENLGKVIHELLNYCNK